MRDGICVDHAPRDYEIWEGARQHRTERNLVIGRVNCRFRPPSTFHGWQSRASIRFRSIKVLERNARLVLVMDINPLTPLCNGISETATVEHIVAGKLITAPDMTRLAHPDP